MKRSNLKYLLFVIGVCCMMYALQSCSTEKRAQRHLKKAFRLNPELKKKDTVLIQDTIKIEEVRKDTVIHLDVLRDTFLLEKDKLSVKLIKVHDSVYIYAKCDSDTIYYNKEIEVEKIIYKNYPKPIQKILDNVWWFFIFCGIFLLLLLRIRNK